MAIDTDTAEEMIAGAIESITEATATLERGFASLRAARGEVEHEAAAAEWRERVICLCSRVEHAFDGVEDPEADAIREEIRAIVDGAPS